MGLKAFLFIGVLFTMTNCNTEMNRDYIEKIQDPEFFQASMQNLTDIIVHDIFSPPVASRVFAYPNVAAYEILVQKDTTYASLVHTANGLNSIPKIGENPNINANVNNMTPTAAAMIYTAPLTIFSQLIFFIYSNISYM